MLWPSKAGQKEHKSGRDGKASLQLHDNCDTLNHCTCSSSHHREFYYYKMGAISRSWFHSCSNSQTPLVTKQCLWRAAELNQPISCPTRRFQSRCPTQRSQQKVFLFCQVLILIKWSRFLEQQLRRPLPLQAVQPSLQRVRINSVAALPMENRCRLDPDWRFWECLLEAISPVTSHDDCLSPMAASARY